MDLHEMPVCNLPLGLGDDAGFDFKSLPSGCPTGSVSGSSYASSSFDPHTPTSGRSPPPFTTSFDFGSSFTLTLDPGPVDLTPPPSSAGSSAAAHSTYFPMTPKTAGSIPDFVYPGFPITPSRAQFDFFRNQLNTSGPQLTTPQPTMDCSFLLNQLSPHQIMSTTPPITTQFDHISEARPASQENKVMTPPTSERKRALMGEARHRTTALQHAQQCSSPNQRPPVKRERKARAVVTEDGGSFAVDSVEPASTFKCPMAGCKVKPYRRNEHMKRHVVSVHGGSLFPCGWCKHMANRRDNWVAHLKLHTLVRAKSGGKPRVDFYPGAVMQYAEEMKKNQSRRRQTGKVKGRQTSAA
ncbi:hypothetical protein C8A05DRAFT_40742 [Staphylotrichum tortipilum]|uniref:C2H2-type domain-containing protein n=1 Tax=Staphylotrichum tortipilum TaxID=2831512 RepID=A0AAN6RXG3_9PEZI|nr:hypothetical protein C8A05DRAFT_40742 [Staphylotrichum longicolle]